MTSLDFKSLLRQEKAKLLQIQTVTANVGSTSAVDDTAIEGGRKDGVVHVDEDDGALGSLGLAQSLSFVELARRSPLEMEKASYHTADSK